MKDCPYLLTVAESVGKFGMIVINTRTLTEFPWSKVNKTRGDVTTGIGSFGSQLNNRVMPLLLVETEAICRVGVLISTKPVMWLASVMFPPPSHLVN